MRTGLRNTRKRARASAAPTQAAFSGLAARTLPFALCSLFSVGWAAWGANAAATSQPQTVIVTGTPEPVPLEESDRSVNVYPLHVFVPAVWQPDRCAIAGFLCASAGARARRSAGRPLDSRRRICAKPDSDRRYPVERRAIGPSRPGSAHSTGDAVNRIEILRGSGSTLYGSEAVAGVVNVVTLPATRPSDWRCGCGQAMAAFRLTNRADFCRFPAGSAVATFFF